MTEEQSQSFLSLGNRGASNLPRGQAIYNAENGARDGNVEFAVDLISPEQLTAIVAKSNERNAMLAPLDRVRI